MSYNYTKCPICGVGDMAKQRDGDGFLIECVNHACASNGGSEASAFLPKSTALTTSEALDILHAKAPTWTFAATKEAWIHVQKGGTATRQEKYTVSAHPVLGGACCELFEANTLQSAVDQCIAKLFPEPENNLE